MADASVDLKELEQVVDLSTQLSNVSRRMSQGSYTMGLVGEYEDLVGRLGDLITPEPEPLPEDTATVKAGEYTFGGVKYLLTVTGNELTNIEVVSEPEPEPEPEPPAGD